MDHVHMVPPYFEGAESISGLGLPHNPISASHVLKLGAGLPASLHVEGHSHLGLMDCTIEFTEFSLESVLPTRLNTKKKIKRCLHSLGLIHKFQGNGFSIRNVAVLCRNELSIQLVCEYMSVATSLSTKCITRVIKKNKRKNVAKKFNYQKKKLPRLHCCVL